MLKIIWNKRDLENIKKKLYDTYNIVLTVDPNDLPHDKVGLMVEEEDVEKIKLVLEMINQEKSQIILQTQQGWIQVYIHHMTYLESFGEEIYLHQENLPTEIIMQPLYQLEALLKPYHFVRIGKSFIVNITKIRYIRTGFIAKLDLELVTHEHLTVSRSFVSDFKNALGIQKKED
ncbi:MAG: LytTR family DNA-binding domain-containing protein, partial [Acholeplasmataceae bacterium]|nr:LytTR family DNA-binding domain-containing protein [Acholeplasmataceae bacterium]